MRGLGIVAIENQARSDTPPASRAGDPVPDAAAPRLYPPAWPTRTRHPVMGSNMPSVTRCLPLADAGQGARAKLIHVDPRFTRTSAMADIHAPIRGGLDMAFLGGLVTIRAQQPGWNTDPFFKSFFVTTRTRPPSSRPSTRTPEDLERCVLRAEEYRRRSRSGRSTPSRQYDNKTWQSAGPGARPAPAGRRRRRQSGEQQPRRERGRTRDGGPAERRGHHVAEADAAAGPPSSPGEVAAQAAGSATTRSSIRACVFQIVSATSRATRPSWSSGVTGCPKETFLKVAETLLNASGADKTTSFAYAVAWTQHTNGPNHRLRRAPPAAARNVGRPGAGSWRCRHASIQGSTTSRRSTFDHGYMSASSALRRTDPAEWLAAETSARGYWANTPKFMVSYLKSMYGAAATKDTTSLATGTPNPRRPLASADVRGHDDGA